MLLWLLIIAKIDSPYYNLRMTKETNLLKLSNMKMKSSRLKEIITENKKILGKEDFIEILIDKKYIKKEELLSSSKASKLEKQLRVLQEESVRMLTVLDGDYPLNLKDLEDAPPVLYCRGKLLPRDSNSVSIVGTRRASEYGRTVARTLAKQLAALGITIISGMASGIDTQAHIGALSAGGRTLAVMGTGIDLIYPSSNRNLAKKIVENGVLITELPPNAPALPYHFPSRNRIISGLSKAVVAIEAPFKSGVFSTVRWALQYGRDVYALPGDIHRTNSEGTNKLIKEGAIPFTSYKDILENTVLAVKETNGKNGKKVHDLSENEEKIYKVLEMEPKGIDLLAKEAGLKPEIVMPMMALLELKGFVREIPGKRFIREE
jgi:DNA processing protein